MNSTAAPPPSGQEHVHAPPGGSTDAKSARQAKHPPPSVFGVGLLILAFAHLAAFPGIVIAGQRVGWDGNLWPLETDMVTGIINWPLGSLVIATTIICYGLAALRPLGLPLGPRNWMRWAVAGALISVITYPFLWPGLQPHPVLFAVLPLAGLAILAARLLRAFNGSGPLAGIESHMGLAPRRSWYWRIPLGVGKGLATFVAVLAVMITTWFFVPVSTPAIVDAQGNHVPGSVASLEKVNLNGSEQWVLMRGTSTHNPVLLWLAGGPGGSDLGAMRRYHPALEKHFIVVNWEQRGAGKSFPLLFTDQGKMHPQQYVKDGLALTNYLRHRFHQNRIYVGGESWGTFLGIWMVQQRSNWFAAYVGDSQMVNTHQNDLLEYNYLLQRARREGNTGRVSLLVNQGPPPYTGNPIDVARKMAPIGLAAVDYMHRDVEAHGGTQLDNPVLNVPEYRPIDMVYWILGPTLTVGNVYPKLDAMHVDFVKQASHLKVPIYFVEGRYDYNAPSIQVVRYYRALHAPLKRSIWFERSAHPVITYNEQAKFDRFMVNTVLRETQAQARVGKISA